LAQGFPAWIFVWRKDSLHGFLFGAEIPCMDFCFAQGFPALIFAWRRDSLHGFLFGAGIPYMDFCLAQEIPTQICLFGTVIPFTEHSFPWQFLNNSWYLIFDYIAYITKPMNRYILHLKIKIKIALQSNFAINVLP